MKKRDPDLAYVQGKREIFVIVEKKGR